MAQTLLRCALLASSLPAVPLIRGLRARQAPRFPIRALCFSGVGSTNYLSLSDEELMGQCEMDTFKASGPGGQHRNKRESAVRLKHLPTGVVAQAAEDRSQHKNGASALVRLRTLLALKASQEGSRLGPLCTSSRTSSDPTSKINGQIL